jgi:glycosyltransferase involved in cell wall biosynthesis
MNKRICMVVFSYCPADPRPRREAEALVGAGFEVDIICLRNQDESAKETVRGVTHYRMPLQKKRGGKIRYLWEYTYFGLLAFLKLSWLWLGKRYRIVHVHNMPDILVFTALLPRLFGSKVILDLHDPMPEVFIAKYGMAEDHKVIKTLRWFEKLSTGFAHQIITPNIAFKKLFVGRSCPDEKVLLLMNSPDESIFKPSGKAIEKDPDQFVVMYHGTIVERNGLGTALYAMAKLKDRIPNLVFHVYGEGDFVPRFLEIKDELALGEQVQYHGFSSLETIAHALENIDLGIIPNLRSPFTEINMPTRIFECLRMNKPVIVPDTLGIRDYFKQDELYFFDAGNADDLADVIYQAYADPVARQAMLEKGLKVCESHWWAQEKQQLIQLDEKLCGAA